MKRNNNMKKSQSNNTQLRKRRNHQFLTVEDVMVIRRVLGDTQASFAKKIDMATTTYVRKIEQLDPETTVVKSFNINSFMLLKELVYENDLLNQAFLHKFSLYQK